MIKKLSNNKGVQKSSTLTGIRELLREYRNKTNELIDYLQTKKEVACETCGKKQPHFMLDHWWKPPTEEASKGGCKHENIGYELPRDKGKFNAPPVCMDCGKNLAKDNPPEHEIDPETLCSKCGNWKGCHPIKECKTFIAPQQEESKGGCDKCGGLPFKHEEWCGKPQLKEESPKEDEELGQDLYELMQTYRHTPITDQKETTRAYEDVKNYILKTHVSKEKIKRVARGTETRFSNKTVSMAIEHLLVSLGLGD